MAVTAFSTAGGLTPGSRTVIPSSMSLGFGGFIRNKIINGAFNIWQRATSFSTPANAAYTADRWRVNYDGTIGTFSVARTTFTVGQTAVPGEPTYHLTWNQTAAGSGSSFRNIEQRIENVSSLAGERVALTFYAKADSGRILTVDPRQNFGSGGSTEVTITPLAGASCSLTTSWQKFYCEFIMPSITGKTVNAGNCVRVIFQLPINSTMTIDLARVQLEQDSETDFDERPLAFEYDLCQRYYQKFGMLVPDVAVTSYPMSFKAVMRSSPTISGGGAGFATVLLTEYGGSCGQTSVGNQTVELEAEL